MDFVGSFVFCLLARIIAYVLLLRCPSLHTESRELLLLLLLLFLGATEIWNGTRLVVVLVGLIAGLFCGDACWCWLAVCRRRFVVVGAFCGNPKQKIKISTF